MFNLPALVNFYMHFYFTITKFLFTDFSFYPHVQVPPAPTASEQVPKFLSDFIHTAFPEPSFLIPPIVISPVVSFNQLNVTLFHPLDPAHTHSWKSSWLNSTLPDSVVSSQSPETGTAPFSASICRYWAPEANGAPT